MTENLSPEWETHIKESKFMQQVLKDIYGPREGGAIIVIDAQNARRGIAKTSAQVAFAKFFSNIFGYDLSQEDLTLSGQYYVRRLIEHPGGEQPSVVSIDEFVGAGAGDKRKAMTNKNIFLAKVWQMVRKKRIISIIALPDIYEIDKRMRKYIDYRLWCLEDPIGIVQPYKIQVPFWGGNTTGGAYPKGMGFGRETEKLTFPNMDKLEDPLYEYLTEKKDNVIDDGSFDADEVESRLENEESEEEQLSEKEIERRTKIKIALNMYKPWSNEVGMSGDAVSHAIDMSDGWVTGIGRDWKRGKYRDIVPKPDDEPTDAI